MTHLPSNPPPKPPSCPDSPELANITLADGTLAEVVIFELDGVVLYVPKDWEPVRDLKDGMQSPMKAYDGSFDKPIRVMVPDYHSDECPGVIHKIQTRGLALRIGDFVRDKIPYNISRNAPLSAIGVGFKLYGKKEFLISTLDTWRVRRIFEGDTVIHFRTLKKIYSTEDDKKKLDDESLRLVNWLRTPPVSRDDQTVFFEDF